MAVHTNTETLSKQQAEKWIEDRGIERLPRGDERLEFVPAGSFNQYDLERGSAGTFILTAHILQ